MGPSVSRAGAAVLLGGAATLFVTSCMVSGQVQPGYPASSGLEWNVDRPGSDYRSFDLVQPSPDICQSTCMNEPQCVAFTYVNPGVQGPNARCWLKNNVPQPVQQTCCVSGVKYGGAPPPQPEAAPQPEPAPPPSAWQGQPPTPPPPPTPAAPPPSAWQGQPPTPPQPPAPPPSAWQGQPAAPPPPPRAAQWEPRTDRPGMDYRSFDLPAPRPELCRDACWREPQCRAFTYVRPGVQGPNARCWLKNPVPPARLNDCCLSGVK
jgi:1-phosphatidylinositol phosphodiesterase